jgi:hypothetical protein
LRIVLGVRQEPIGEGAQSGFLGDFRFGASLRLVGEIDVLEPALGVSGQDRRLERVRELALFTNRLEDRRPSLLQLAQIVQPLFERAQLRVVERASGFFAIARDKRHRGAAIEQRDGCLNLLLTDTKGVRYLPMNRLHQHTSTETATCRTLPARFEAGGHMFVGH